MTLDELRNGIPPMPDDYRGALLKTLSALPDAPRASVPRWYLAPFVAVLLILALAGGALAAAHSQILRWLLASDSPSEALERLAHPLELRAEADGIAVTLTGAACDGNQLSLSWQIENAEPNRPALVYLQSATLGDQDILRLARSAALMDARWVPSFHLDTLPAARNPLEDGATLSLLAPPPDGSLVSVSFAVLRPTRAMVVIDERMHEDLSALDEDARMEIDDAKDTLLSFEGISVAPAGHMEAGDWLARGFLPIDASGGILLADGWEAEDPFDGLFEETAVLTIAFSPDVSQADVCDLTPDLPILLQECAVYVDALVLTPLSTRLTLRLIPEENTRQAAQALLNTFGEITLLNEAGTPLDYLEMDYLSSCAGQVHHKAGQWFCLYALDLPGVRSTPHSLEVRALGNGESLFSADVTL